MTALLALVSLLLALQHSFSGGFEPSVCCSDILRLQFLKVKEPKELFIAAEEGLPPLVAQVCTKHSVFCLPPWPDSTQHPNKKKLHSFVLDEQIELSGRA